LTDRSVQKDAETAPQKSLPANAKHWEGSSAVVQQGRHWSSALIWITSSLFGVVLIWAFLAKVDQTISVRGRLQPAGSVLEVDSPSSGVVSKVFVREGQLVKAGQPLLDVEARGLASRRLAIEQSLQILKLQANSISTVIASNGDIKKIASLPSLPLVADPSIAQILANARNQTQQITAQLNQIDTRLKSRQESLLLKQKIADDIKPLFQSGAMARNAYLTQLNEVQELRAEISSLKEEKIRVVGSASTQLNEINRQTINLDSELVGLKEAISYRTIHAPIAGRIFDSKVGTSSVVSADQIILKIVPENKLQAVIDISNVDVGFVKVGQDVSVSVDSFPSGEFGYIKGNLIKVGSDALKPDQLVNQYRFPAMVSLKQQHVISGDKELNLQSGMSITANIKLRSRPAISIVTDLFTKQFEGVKKFR
jgi:HlyD family secretion protein